MKKFIVFLFLFVSTNAFAISDQELMRTCYKTGVEKLISQAMAFGCKFNEDAAPSSIDNRWWNPYKYVSYAATAECPNETRELQQLVQYSSGECR